MEGSHMAKEYLVALFDRNRRVRINDEFMGRTNWVIELEAGRYRVSLGPPWNFTPDEHVILLRHTSSASSWAKQRKRSDAGSF